MNLQPRPNLIATCLLLAGLLLAADGFAQAVNPLQADPRAARLGGSLFRAQCATCHGADAKGIAAIDAPDLTLMWVENNRSDGEVFDIIRDGIPGSIMPPHSFTDTEVWMLVSYLRSVGVGGNELNLDGDPSRGVNLFATHCARCHRVDGEGGSLGPDLSSITGRRSLEALLQSIREPGTSIARGYKPVALTTAAGERLTGTIKSEDAFSIQIMDSNQQLRGFSKSQLRALDKNVPSLMPPFTEAQLRDADIEDILSYLQAER